MVILIYYKWTNVNLYNWNVKNVLVYVEINIMLE